MRSILRKIIITAVLLAFWQAAAVIVDLEVLLPSPASVMRAFFKLITLKDFYFSSFLSLLRVSLGFLAGLILGIVSAVISRYSLWLKDTFSIILAVMKAAPVASFIILALVWLERGNVPVFASFLIVMPLVFSACYTSVGETDPLLLEMSKAFSVKKLSVIKNIYVPSIKPFLLSASTTAMGMAWKAGIAAEVIASPKNSIGYYINNSKIYLDTASLFAWTISVIILSMLLEKVLKLISSRTKKRSI